MSKLYVIHENPEWYAPLAEAFDRAGVPHEQWLLGEAAIDLGSAGPSLIALDGSITRSISLRDLSTPGIILPSATARAPQCMSPHRPGRGCRPRR